MVDEKLGDDLDTNISEIGVVPDWSAAYTPNSGPMDAVMKIQMKEDRKHSAQEAVQALGSSSTTTAAVRPPSFPTWSSPSTPAA